MKKCKPCFCYEDTCRNCVGNVSRWKPLRILTALREARKLTSQLMVTIKELNAFREEQDARYEAIERYAFKHGYEEPEDNVRQD